MALELSRVYPPDFEDRVGFTPLRERIAASALCQAGRSRIMNSTFSNDREAIALASLRIEEMRAILHFQHGFPQEDYIDFSPSLPLLLIHTQWYTLQDIATLRLALMTLWAICEFLQASESTPALRDLASSVQVPEWILERISGLLEPSGTLADTASPELQRIRHAMAALQGQIMRRMQQMLRNAQRDGLVDEATQIVMRDGRPLIPIPARNKGAFRAIVQGHSATGQTLFIEPYESLELANQMRDLLQEEQEEINRILREFTDELRPEYHGLLALFAFLGEIDAIRAKALYAINVGGARPIISDFPVIDIRRAYHPALFEACARHGRQPVPLNLRLDTRKRILVISGPNAGGKSVALKCVALAVYMHQSGFLPILAENSELGIFEEILIDIGDTQSIESDLSTYSAHLAAMNHFLRHASPRTLCFIDEFGGGTEPRAGGAIAEAILERLVHSQTLGIITTHFENLKLCADRIPALFNGAMRYDLRTLKPLYVLEVDQPGSSFPFQIARQMGLPADVLKHAETIVGKEYVGLEMQLHEVMQQRKELERKHLELNALHAQIELLQAKLKETSTELDSQRKLIIQQAKAEAQSIIKESNRAVERTIREIREAAADKVQTKNARAKLRAHSEALTQCEPVPCPVPQPIPQKAEPTLQPGAMVRISGMDTVGEVISLSGKKAVIAVGQIYTSVPVAQLLPLTDSQVPQPQRSSTRSGNVSAVQQRRMHFTSSLDLRGQRKDEALQAVAEFIDDAIMLNVDRVRILHGKGNGILRQSIREYLADHSAVRRAYDEAEALGGAGITVVEFV